MRLARLRLRDFRSYERAEVELGEGLTVVSGPNGAGKTNLLEAAYFALTARSPRTSNERELVRRGASVTRVEADIEGGEDPHALEVAFTPGEPKRVRVDGAAVEGASPQTRPAVVVFLPDRLELVKGAPSLRRGAPRPAGGRPVAGARGDALGLLARARPAQRAGGAHPRRRSLAGRARRLGRRAGAPRGRADVRPPGGRRGARPGLRGDGARAGAARAGGAGLPPALAGRPTPRASRPSWPTAAPPTWTAASPRTGPTATTSPSATAALSLRSYGSQGQQRTALLALLFAERDLLADRRGTPPLVLLDDVMSELDEARRERLAERLRDGGQAVLTATEPGHVPGAVGPAGRPPRGGPGIGARGHRDGRVRRLAPRPLAAALADDRRGGRAGHPARPRAVGLAGRRRRSRGRRGRACERAPGGGDGALRVVAVGVGAGADGARSRPPR